MQWLPEVNHVNGDFLNDKIHKGIKILDWPAVNGSIGNAIGWFIGVEKWR